MDGSNDTPTAEEIARLAYTIKQTGEPIPPDGRMHLITPDKIAWLQAEIEAYGDSRVKQVLGSALSFPVSKTLRSIGSSAHHFSSDPT